MFKRFRSHGARAAEPPGCDHDREEVDRGVCAAGELGRGVMGRSFDLGVHELGESLADLFGVARWQLFDLVGLVGE